MYSVDRAAEQFFGASGRQFELIKFTGHARIGRLRYRIVDSPADLDRYHTVIYWGDFQQNPMWGQQNFGRRHARKHRTSLREGVRRWKQTCLQMDRPRVAGQRVFSVGTCFLGARSSLHDSASLSEYAGLLARFDAIVPRDPGSVAELQALGLTNVVPGFDCASLLDGTASTPTGDQSFGYAFGRTFSESEGRNVARTIARVTGYRAVPIRWLLQRHKPRWCDFRYARALRVIRETRFIVTDIYHLAINTLNLGRDLRCVGKQGAFLDTCHDLKKAHLLRMSNLADRYVEIPPGTVDQAAYVVRAVAACPATSTASETFDRLRSECRHRLQRLLFELPAVQAGVHPPSSPSAAARPAVRPE